MPSLCQLPAGSPSALIDQNQLAESPVHRAINQARPTSPCVMPIMRWEFKQQFRGNWHLKFRFQVTISITSCSHASVNRSSLFVPGAFLLITHNRRQNFKKRAEQKSTVKWLMTLGNEGKMRKLRKWPIRVAFSFKRVARIFSRSSSSSMYSGNTLWCRKLQRRMISATRFLTPLS